MNRKTLQKIIDELAKESPRIPYVLGVLETLIDSLPEDKVSTMIYGGKTMSQLNPPVRNELPTIGSNELDNVAASRIAEIKKMAGDGN